MNTMFREPVVHSARGGSNGGGATLTPLGAEVLRLYRAVETTASAAGAEDIDRLHGLLADMATGK